jgi:exodeoxyribonuclease III
MCTCQWYEGIKYIMKMKRFAFFALMILFVLPGCFMNPDKRSREGDNLKIVSYNVWYGFTMVPERKDKWIAWMKEQQPDVVSLQELNEYSSEKLAENAKSYGHEYSVLLKEDGFPTGITSRYPIEDVKKMREGFHHGLLRVRIQDIYFYVIHLHPSNHETRKKEIDLILNDIEQLPAGSEVILAGDFNTFSPLDSVYYAHGRLESFFSERDKKYNERNLNNGRLDYGELLKLMESGLVDLEAEYRTSTYHFTGSFPTALVKEGDHGDNRRLDYVFASKELAGMVSKVEIISDDTTHALSDHLPVVVEIERD